MRLIFPPGTIFSWFNQGNQRSALVVFHDYKPVFEANKQLPNVAIFIKQINIFKELLEKAGPDKVQDMDPIFSLPLGEMFSIVVYGQLILEQAKFDSVDPDIINQIFDFMVRRPLCPANLWHAQHQGRAARLLQRYHADQVGRRQCPVRQSME